MKKKILIFSLVYYPKHVHGGAEVAIKEITDRIDTEDIEFHMVTLGFDSGLPKVSREGNVLVHRIGLTRTNIEVEDFKIFPLRYNKYLYQVLAAWKAMRLHRKYHYDAIWSVLVHSAGIPSAIFKIFYPKVSYVLTLQEGDSPENIERQMSIVWPLFSRAFTSATVIQTISHFLANWAERRHFKGPIEVIPNGFTSSNLKNDFSEKDLADLRKKLGKKGNEVYLVTVSRLVHKNAVDDVVRALSFLPAHIKFLVVGSGPDEEKLKELVEELSVKDRVIFVGQVDRNQTILYRNISDIFIRASRSEGMGNSFVSTMVARLPIIATQEGGIADFLFDKKRNPDKETTGWAVDKDSPEQIAEAVKDILAHPAEVKKVTENAYQLAITDYNWDTIAQNMRKKVFEVAFRERLKK